MTDVFALVASHFLKQEWEEASPTEREIIQKRLDLLEDASENPGAMEIYKIQTLPGLLPAYSDPYSYAFQLEDAFFEDYFSGAAGIITALERHVMTQEPTIASTRSFNKGQFGYRVSYEENDERYIDFLIDPHQGTLNIAARGVDLNDTVVSKIAEECSIIGPRYSS